jgi:hypothetical protein
MAAGKNLKSATRQSHRDSDDSSMNREDVDFGTYHHSTPQESNEIRRGAEMSFSKLLQGLYPPTRLFEFWTPDAGWAF